jgi:hypothetical protein
MSWVQAVSENIPTLEAEKIETFNEIYICRCSQLLQKKQTEEFRIEGACRKFVSSKTHPKLYSQRSQSNVADLIICER